MLCVLGCVAAYTPDPRHGSALAAQRRSEFDSEACVSASGTEKDTAWCVASCAASSAACPASFCEDGCRDTPTESAAETPEAGAADEEDGAQGAPSNAQQDDDAGTSDRKDRLHCTTYVAASPATTHIWCTAACKGGCTPEDQLVCKCDEDEEGAAQEDEHACVSISVKKTTEWCNLACGLQEGGCPRDAVKHCRCGAAAFKPSTFSKAAKAAAARERAANEAMATPISGAAADTEPPPGGVYVGEDGLVKARAQDSASDQAEPLHTFGDGHNHDQLQLHAAPQV